VTFRLIVLGVESIDVTAVA